MKNWFVLLLLVCFGIVNAQTDNTASDSTDTADTLSNTDVVSPVDTTAAEPGKLIIYQDAYYGAVEDIQKKINKENCPNLVKGYRVQVFSCSGGECKDKSNKYYNQFLIAYPDLAVYKLYQPPSIKVRAGNCRTRFEAEALKSLIEKDFPFVFIVPDYIESDFSIECDDMILPAEEKLDKK